MGTQMSSVALKLYQGLTDVGEDKDKAKIFADAFAELEDRYPEVKDIATGTMLSERSLELQAQIKETDANLRMTIKDMELNVQKDIKDMELNVQKDIKDMELNVQKDMKDMELSVQKDMKDMELNIQKEIKDIELSIQKDIRVIDSNMAKNSEDTNLKIKELEVHLVDKMGKQTWLYLGGISIIGGVLKYL